VNEQDKEADILLYWNKSPLKKCWHWKKRIL